MTATRPKNTGQASTQRSIKLAIARLCREATAIEGRIGTDELTTLREERKLCRAQERALRKTIAEEFTSDALFIPQLHKLEALGARLDRLLRARPSHSVRSTRSDPPQRTYGREAASLTVADAAPLIGSFDRLHRRLSGLRGSLKQSALDDAEKELKKCMVLAANVAEAVKSSKIPTHVFLESAQDVQELVIDISSDLERMKNVWWRKAWKTVKENLSTLLKPVLGLLGVPTGQKLLTYERTKRIE